jgi:hypothetical protein
VSAPQAAARPRICFLVGAPRSGTTWLQRALQAHPLICGGEESHFFTLFAHPMRAADEMAADPARVIGPLAYLDRAAYDAALRALWDAMFHDLYATHAGALVHLEKTPEHSLHLDQIDRLFPDASVVFITRDSRAVVASLVDAGRSWGAHWAPRTHREAAILWRRYVTAVMRWRDKRPDRPFLTVRFEDATADLSGQLERILGFLLPQTTDLRVNETLAAFEAQSRDRVDPEGFARLRGPEGWRRELPLSAKFLAWRYTRKAMRMLDYGIGPFG